MPVPDFSPGEVLTAAAMDSIGLWKVASVTATTGTAVSVPNCFSADYDAYRIVVTNLKLSAAAGLDWQLANGGSPVITGYYWNYINGGYATTTSYSQQGAANSSLWGTMGVADSTNTGGVAADIFNPFLATTTTVAGDRTDPRTTGAAGRFVGYHSATTSYSGLYFTAGGATFNSINIVVYGYRK
jgi:hypothetical protein